MSLTSNLANLAAQNHSAVPENIRIVMDQARSNLINSGVFDRYLQVGDIIPSVILPNATGKLIDIQTCLQTGPVIISFYHGRWCPYCSLELLAWQQGLSKIEAQNATLIAISPQTLDNSLLTKKAHGLKFEVLSDIGNQVARKFGLVFTVPETVRSIYEEFGIDLPVMNGDSTFELPISATLCCEDQQGDRHTLIRHDHTQWQDPEDIVRACF
ncbi:MAG: AhpC/TSA family protein [Leptolyngbyaceae cyanobacterium CRU_2_3]|nr:AhpC/TSA family protein [Leptolyngbyaceae cyanobacterium CRU_2_3]